MSLSQRRTLRAIGKGLGQTTLHAVVRVQSFLRKTQPLLHQWALGLTTAQVQKVDKALHIMQGTLGRTINGQESETGEGKHGPESLSGFLWKGMGKAEQHTEYV